jgi:hypothetical protein
MKIVKTATKARLLRPASLVGAAGVVVFRDTCGEVDAAVSTLTALAVRIHGRERLSSVQKRTAAAPIGQKQ